MEGYPISEAVQTDLNNRFTYHAPKPEIHQAERYESMRAHAKALAEEIVRMTPASREQSLALTNLDQVVFWANAAIARHE